MGYGLSTMDFLKIFQTAQIPAYIIVDAGFQCVERLRVACITEFLHVSPCEILHNKIPLTMDYRPWTS
jgi:hypothetical protein